MPPPQNYRRSNAEIKFHVIASSEAAWQSVLLFQNKIRLFFLPFIAEFLEKFKKKGAKKFAIRRRFAYNEIARRENER
ncbi:MAG: hypothetical protein IKY61_01260 [Thermoguttaceae bacterium]|nr:hypothetical protein [Thermoguttaceae bacterium]